MRHFFYGFCIALAVLSVAIATWRFFLGEDGKPAIPTSTSEAVGPEPSAATEEAPEAAESAAVVKKALARSFESLERKLGNNIGVSFGPLDGSTQTTLGTLRSGVAWSTSKVPVAIAAINEGGSADATMSAAITKSDNASAESMWKSLGSPAQAGEKVDAVFRDAGDQRTRTQTERVRPPFTAFGQTIWSVGQQQRFARYVACERNARPVYRLMGKISADQSWGIGSADPQAHFKGGWGPTTNNGYLVRQLGVMKNKDGEQVAVAMIVDTPASDQNVGAAHLTRVAKWIRQRAPGSDGC